MFICQFFRIGKGCYNVTMRSCHICIKWLQDKKIIESESEESDEETTESNGDNQHAESWSVVERGKKKQNNSKEALLVTPIVIRTRSRIGNRDDVEVSTAASNSNPASTQDGGEVQDDDEMPMDDTSQDQPIELVDPNMLGNKTIFVTKKSEGSLKDVLIVECIKINGGQFKGTITLTEAREKIFIEKLGLPANLLHSFKMNFGKFRSVSFKLNEQIDVDDLADKESFEFSRQYMSGDTGRGGRAV